MIERKEMMLFDLDNDPRETKDLLNVKPEVFMQMKALLAKEKQSWQNSYNGKDYKW